jgi:hypothetical protein
MHISNTFLNANNKFAFFKNMTHILNSFVSLTSNFLAPTSAQVCHIVLGQESDRGQEESRLNVLVEDRFHTF